MLRYLLLLLSFLISIVFSTEVPKIFHEYCVVGAGPGGLQSAYFLERSGRDYIVLEKENVAGAFYLKYPRHRKVISINKRHTGKTNKEFNFRHDWNSLISDDESLLMKHYSKEFFPPADSLVKYFNDFATKLKLKIQYNTYIKHVTRREQPEGFKHPLFSLKDQNGTEYNCYYLIMSTGIWVENIPKHFKGIEYTERYSEISTNPDDYEGQSVLIVGRGNSAFETADSIMGSTNFIHMFSRSRVRLSWETHYVGDLRAINNGVLDTYQLKSLDALLEAPIEQLGVVKKNGKLWVDAEDGSGAHIAGGISPNEMPDNFAVREPYDRIILCLGFKFDFSIFDNSTMPKAASGKRAKKYPSITPSYQSTTIPRLYFSGTNTHSLDFRKSAGGFIHGFRYTARALHHIMEHKHHGVTWPHTRLPITELLNFIIKRINEGSGFYQMFSVLGDVIIFRENGEFEYFEEFPIKLVHRFERYTGRPSGPMIVINMEYGKGFSGAGKDIFRPDRATGEPSDAHTSNFLHPVMYFYSEPPTELDRGSLPRPDRLHHIVEDFLTLWDGQSSHILPLRRYLEYITDSDLREFFAQSCFKMLMTHASVPRSCQQHYLNGPMLPGTEDLLDVARAATLMY